MTVNLEFSGAKIGEDFSVEPESQSITIPACSLTGTADISAIDNNTYSAGNNKTVTVDVKDVKNGYKGEFTLPSLIITDNDEIPEVNLSISQGSISEDGSDKATVTATLTNKSIEDVTVHLKFSGAVQGEDFTAEDTIVIPAGSLSNSIDVTGVKDSVYNVFDERTEYRNR